MRIRQIHATIAILSTLTLFSIGYWYINETSDGYRPLLPIPKGERVPFGPRAVYIEERTEYASISGSYPQFDHGSVALNNEIRNVVKNAIEEHKTMSEANWKAMQETADPTEEARPTPQELFPFTVRFETTVSNESLISVIIHIAQYSGGAHGTTSMYTFTYDVAHKKMLTLKDIFQEYPDYLEKLSIESRKQLAEHFKSVSGDEAPTLDFLKEGTEPKPELFSLFTISPEENMLTVYFSVYQVAPYAYGEQRIIVPLPRTDETPEWLK